MCPNLTSNHLNVVQLSPPTKYDYGLPVKRQRVLIKRLGLTELSKRVHVIQLLRDLAINKMHCCQRKYKKKNKMVFKFVFRLNSI